MSEESKKQGKSKREENLKKGFWKPGQSGNPKGLKPGTKTAPGRSFTELAKFYLEQDDPDQPARTRAERLLESIYRNADEEGDTKAAAIILDRVDPALKKIEVTGVAADAGRGMLDRLLQSTVLPVVPQPGVSIPAPIHTNGHSANGNGTNGHTNGSK